MAITVPSVAMLSVSQIGRPSWRMEPQSGGTMRAREIGRPAAGASQTKAQIVLSEISSQQ